MRVMEGVLIPFRISDATDDLFNNVSDQITLNRRQISYINSFFRFPVIWETHKAVNIEVVFPIKVEYEYGFPFRRRE